MLDRILHYFRREPGQKVEERVSNDTFFKMALFTGIGLEDNPRHFSYQGVGYRIDVGENLNDKVSISRV